MHDITWIATTQTSQWQSKDAAGYAADLKLYQTEQECGDGKNDWRYCRYAWTIKKVSRKRRIKIGEKVIGAILEADSFNTFVVEA